ncbi:related to Oxidoreductase [Phialocephala subalpina]|uniref:D-xylose 1-dehydrogenase (NADP(+), D-xylono-1,5-lactone-forming) n=1 Tax=Phialocephala subalpina TaxID=576137 RepID=A0A1L7XUU7_9HELO|nr:related to Oxidoreductase [Phialocephala subalpina]
MGVLISTLYRIWAINYPPTPPKNSSAIRVGILSTAWINSLAIITPSSSHPGVTIAAVASRSLERAAAYAERFGIEKWYGSYEELLADPGIDAVYIPLPNGLHAHWAQRALEAGKHVLLEKPFTSNASCAQALVNFHNSLPEPRPVLLEAFHFRFHPAWRFFLSLVAPMRKDRIEEASAQFSVQSGFFKPNDIRWEFDLAGGALMDIGTYSIAALRDVFGTEPEEVLGADVRMHENGGEGKVDEGVKAWYQFPGGGVGSIDGSIAERGWFGLPRIRIPKVMVKGKEVEVKGSDRAGNGEVHLKRRTLTMWNFPGPHFWHSIQILDQHTIRRAADGLTIKSWAESEYKTAYTWAWMATKIQDAAHWSTYRHMLDQFINKVQGKEGSGVWISGEDSIKQMKAIDDTYEKARLPVRLARS